VKGLPSDLRELCKQEFLKCEQFESYQRLCSFCRGYEALYFLNIQLNQALSRAGLVEENLSIFIEKKHEEYGWILPIFVKALATNCYEGDARRSSLNNLYDRIKAHQKQKQDRQYQSPISPISSSNERLLFNFLLEIDFYEQQNEVKNALKLQQSHQRAAAFLIHGEKQFGQEALVTRLYKLQELRNSRRIKINTSGMSDVSELWNAVANHFIGAQLPTGYFHEQINDLIIECLQTQHLIFIFTEVERTYIGFLPELIELFWQPIVERLNLTETYLVMFIVDNKGKVHKSGIPWAKECTQHEYPKMPLELSPINNFLENQIQEWLDRPTVAEIVPKNLSVNTLLEESKNGVPELVYQRICYYCDSSWEGKLAKWLIQ